MSKWISVYYTIYKKSDPKIKELGPTQVSYQVGKKDPTDILLVALSVVVNVYDMAAAMLGWTQEKYKEELERFKKEVEQLYIGENK